MAEERKYHVNEKGQAGPCKARKRPCRFGGDSGQDNHYPDLKSAQAAAEKRQAELAGGTFTKLKKKPVAPSSLPERTPERVQAWAAVDAARARRDKLADALQRSSWREEKLVKAEAMLARAEDPATPEGSRRSYYNYALQEVEAYSGATGPRDPFLYGSSRYPTPESVREAVGSKRRAFDENVRVWKQDLELNKRWVEEQEALLKAETGLVSDPRYGVPSGEGDVKELYKNRSVGGYSRKPTRSVEVLKDAEHFCTRCNEPASHQENYGWRHSATGEYRCGANGQGDNIISVNPVCSYCGTGNPKHMEFRLEGYADTTTCERCGGVSGYAIGD